MDLSEAVSESFGEDLVVCGEESDRAPVGEVGSVSLFSPCGVVVDENSGENFTFLPSMQTCKRGTRSLPCSGNPDLQNRL